MLAIQARSHSEEWLETTDFTPSLTSQFTQEEKITQKTVFWRKKKIIRINLCGRETKQNN